MRCKHCSRRCRSYGSNASGTKRYQCVRYGRTHSEPRREVGNMYLPFDKACRMAELLVEVCSVRSAAGLSGLHRCTVLSLLANAGQGCCGLLRERIRNVDVDHSDSTRSGGSSTGSNGGSMPHRALDPPDRRLALG